MAGADWDVIVVGGGHNGLVAAARLAKAGMRTLVLERREEVGGQAVTGTLGPARVPTLAHTVGRLRPSVARELDLKAHGLSLVAPKVRVFAPREDGRAVTLWADVGRTAEGLREWSAADAAAYAGFDEHVRGLARFLAELAAAPPPDLADLGVGDALLGLKLGRSFRGLGKARAHQILRVLPMAVAVGLPVAMAGALQATLNWYRFGNPFEFGYGDEPSTGFVTPILDGVGYLLFASGKGLAWFAPPAMVGLAGIAWLAQRRPLVAATAVGVSG